jgi:hypothetical protein
MMPHPECIRALDKPVHLVAANQGVGNRLEVRMFVVNSPVCVVCGNHTVFFLSDEERAAMNSGKLIQDALPDWTAEQREVLISGTHPQCWTSLYGEENDDEQI